MPSFNKVFLMGNLTKDPELRYTSGGAPVANLRMAINRVYKLQSGEQKEEVCYVTVVVWRKQAEAAGEHLKKGDPIFVEGRLQSRSWETEDHQKRSTMEVVAERVQFLSRTGRGAAPTSGEESVSDAVVEETAAPAPSSDEDIPF
jgi:single-strand DNA-binding protein